jgi:Tfp pilus assembly protein PilF
MAKRKKLNKRVVVFLVIFALIAFGGVLTFIFKNLPKDPQFYAELARNAMEEGDYSKAEKALAEAIDASHDPNYYYEMAVLQIEIIKNKPNLPAVERATRQGNCVQMLRTALRRDPKYLKAQQMLTDIHWDHAVLFKRWQQYVEEADKLIELAPTDHETYYRRAAAKAKMAEAVPGAYSEQAIADFQKAIELKGDEPRYWLGLVSVYGQLQRHEDAEAVFMKALGANPDEPELMVKYAAFLQARNRRDEALKHKAGEPHLPDRITWTRR